MVRSFVTALFVVAVGAALLPAQNDIRRGQLKKIDPATGTVIVTEDGKDVLCVVTDKTLFKAADDSWIKDGLKNPAFKPGARVAFKGNERDGKVVLIGMRFPPAGKGPIGKNPPPKIDLSGFKPLTELGTGKYQGFEGGLYPGGKNERPQAHEAAGVALAAKVVPLDRDGKPAPAGKIVLLSIGMSNTTQVFSTFKRLADPDPEKNPQVVIVDGAQGGQTAARVADLKNTGAKFWAGVDQRLQAAGVTRAQVQAAWIKEANAGPSQGFPAYAKELQEQQATIVRLMHERFPNLKLVYLSSRTFAGYATTRLNPEPYAYESGFAVRWLIEQQLKGDPSLNYDPAKGKVQAPWLSWGPYLWANGTTKRADGFFYEQSDFGSDGTHPAQAGQQKVAQLLVRFFKTDTTTRPWFVTK